MKIKLDGVMETLLITLYIRAKDAESPKPYLGDNKSREIIQQIDYDFSKFEMAKGSYYGTLARIRVMDREVKKFITKHPKAKIISIGCGLDSRFERVDHVLDEPQEKPRKKTTSANYASDVRIPDFLNRSRKNF